MEATIFNRLWHFWSELRRRRVVHSAGIYLAACWLILQVIDVTEGPLGIAHWVMTLTVWLAIVGFPIALILSWRFEITRDGIHHTPPLTKTTAEELAINFKDYMVVSFMAAFLVFVSASLISVLKTGSPEVITTVAASNSIAVLPFENLGGREQDEYLGRGLAEDILHRLAMTEGLKVASRTAAFELDMSDLNIAAIGQRLGVQSLLEGSVRREGDQLRIVAQLIDTETGFHIFSRSYDRKMDDLFGIYDEISAAVVSELQLTLKPESTVLIVPPTTDMQAYDYFLQARSMLQRSTRAESAANAQHFFARAIERDPQFAEAWAGQCQAYLEWYYYQPEVVKIDKATSSCLKALELNPELAAGHVAFGELYRKTGHFEEAILEYRAALSSNNLDATAWRGLGGAFAALERTREAEDAMKRALELDPNDLLNFYELGVFYFSLGRYAEAAEVYTRMASHPNAGASAYNSQGAAYYMMGRFEEAAESYRQVMATEPTAVAYSNIGIMYFYNGQYEDAVIMYREAVALAPENPVWWGNLGDGLLELGDKLNESALVYRKAADLAEEMLYANPEDAEILTNLAHYYARLGDDERATRYLSRALFAAPDDTYAHYYAALVHLEAGRLQEALEEIQRSVELGYPIVLLAPDPQFAELRSNKSFLGLIK